MKFLETYRAWVDGKWVRYNHYLDKDGNDVHIEVK